MITIKMLKWEMQEQGGGQELIFYSLVKQNMIPWIN